MGTMEIRLHAADTIIFLDVLRKDLDFKDA